VGISANPEGLLSIQFGGRFHVCLFVLFRLVYAKMGNEFAEDESRDES